MPNPHLAAIRAGVRYDRQLRALTNRMVGTKEHPRGAILAAYRRARRALAGNLDNQAAVAAILNQYRADVAAAVSDGAQAAATIGTEQAAATLEAWDVPAFAGFVPVQSNEAVTSVTATVDGQIVAIQSGVLTEAQILGGRSRVGLFAPGLVQREAANWLGSIAGQTADTFMQDSLLTSGVMSDFVRQAVAVVDERTTPCCLGVHGQIRDMNKMFHTPNPPAYADEQITRPFHDRCRTSIVLVLRAAGDDALTARMKRAATLEKIARDKPGYVAPHPANAFTRTTA